MIWYVPSQVFSTSRSEVIRPLYLPPPVRPFNFPVPPVNVQAPSRVTCPPDAAILPSRTGGLYTRFSPVVCLNEIPAWLLQKACEQPQASRCGPDQEPVLSLHHCGAEPGSLRIAARFSRLLCTREMSWDHLQHMLGSFCTAAIVEDVFLF